MSNVHVRFHKQFLWIILDRPPLNLLTLEMLRQLQEAIHLALRQRPHLLIFAGTGEQDFCTGVELVGDSEEQQLELQKVGVDICTAFDELRTHGIATVALVRGNAFRTGSELVALCDTVIANEKALFRLPAINGKVFPCALSVYLPAAIGQEATTRLVQSGETITAHEARRLGFVHQILAPQRFVADAEELLVMLASLSDQHPAQ